LSDGTILVAGGCASVACNESGSTVDARITAEVVTITGSGTTGTTGGLIVMKDAHVSGTATLIPGAGQGTVLVAGGSATIGGNGQTAAETFASNTFSCIGTNCSGGRVNMANARTLHAASLIASGKILLVGGKGSGGSATSTVEIYDNTGASFTTQAGVPLGTARFALTMTPLTSGTRWVVAGGFTSGTTGSPAVDLYNFDGSTLTLVAASNLFTARGDHTATLLDGGDILVVGGATSPLTGDLFVGP
jgi:hypothetical protein